MKFLPAFAKESIIWRLKATRQSQRYMNIHITGRRSITFRRIGRMPMEIFWIQHVPSFVILTVALQEEEMVDALTFFQPAPMRNYWASRRINSYPCFSFSASPSFHQPPHRARICARNFSFSSKVMFAMRASIFSFQYCRRCFHPLS